MKWYVTELGITVLLKCEARGDFEKMLMIETGDIIKLNQKAPQWASGKAFIVDSVRAWGVVCYTKTAQGELYLRAKWEQIEGPIFTRVKQESGNEQSGDKG